MNHSGWPASTCVAGVLVVLATTSLAACASTTPTAESVTLSIGTDDFPGRPAATQIEQFAARVDELSDGRITIEPVWKAGRPDGEHVTEFDQRVARMVVAGELELGLVPARAWDTEGVDSLRPLQAPFLITDDAVLAAVVADDALVGDLMSGLADAGIRGIAILPEGLRHPFGFEAELTGPTAYESGNLRVPLSDTSQRIYAALGSTTDEADPSPSTHAGMESAFTLLPGGVGVGNVTPYPKANVLVANPEAYAALTDADREVLEQAAGATREWATDEQPTDAEAAEAFCAEGNRVVLAGAADVAALEAATSSVIDEIAAMGDNAGIIARIREIAASTDPSAPVAACGAAATTATGEESALNGSYRFEQTVEENIAAVEEVCGDGADLIGCTPSNSTGPTLVDNSGLWTFTFEDGEYRVHAELGSNGEDLYEVSGPYTVDGDLLSITWTGEPGSPTEVYRWVLDDRGLALDVVDDGGWWWAHAATQEPWERVEP